MGAMVATFSKAPHGTSLLETLCCQVATIALMQPMYVTNLWVKQQLMLILLLLQWLLLLLIRRLRIVLSVVSCVLGS